MVCKNTSEGPCVDALGAKEDDLKHVKLIIEQKDVVQYRRLLSLHHIIFFTELFHAQGPCIGQASPSLCVSLGLSANVLTRHVIRKVDNTALCKDLWARLAYLGIVRMILLRGLAEPRWPSCEAVKRPEHVDSELRLVLRFLPQSSELYSASTLWATDQDGPTRNHKSWTRNCRCKECVQVQLRRLRHKRLHSTPCHRHDRSHLQTSCRTRLHATATCKRSLPPNHAQERICQ